MTVNNQIMSCDTHEKRFDKGEMTSYTKEMDSDSVEMRFYNEIMSGDKETMAGYTDKNGLTVIQSDLTERK